MVTEAAISAAALVMVIKRVLVTGPLLLSKRRMLVPPLQRQTSQARVVFRICSFSDVSDGAENRRGRNKRNHGREPQARQFSSFFSDRERQQRVGAEKGDPQQMNDGGCNERDEQPVAARGRNAQDSDPLGLWVRDCKP